MTNDIFVFIAEDNEKPKANAGGDHSVSLPLRWITLNGSASTDDLKIVSWLWTRESTSLAAGTIIANTDRTSVLMVKIIELNLVSTSVSCTIFFFWLYSSS